MLVPGVEQRWFTSQLLRGLKKISAGEGKRHVTPRTSYPPIWDAEAYAHRQRNLQLWPLETYGASILNHSIKSHRSRQREPIIPGVSRTLYTQIGDLFGGMHDKEALATSTRATRGASQGVAPANDSSPSRGSSDPKQSCAHFASGRASDLQSEGNSMVMSARTEEGFPVCEICSASGVQQSAVSPSSTVASSSHLLLLSPKSICSPAVAPQGSPEGETGFERMGAITKL